MPPVFLILEKNWTALGSSPQAWLVVLAGLGAGLAGRARLPIGMSEGLWTASLSAGLLFNFAAWGHSMEAVFRLGATLVSLALLWLVVAVWVEREAQIPPGAASARREVRLALSAHMALLAGLPGAAALWSTSTPLGFLTPGLILLLVLLLVLVAGFYFWRPGAFSRQAGLALVAALVWLALPKGLVESCRNSLAWALLALGSLALVSVLLTILADWRRRCRIWLAEPHRLIEPPPGHTWLAAWVVSAGVVVGLAAVRLCDASVTPLAVVFAALAVLVTGHWRGSAALGELGLILVCESIVTGVLAWLPTAPAGGLLGMAVAGGYMLWLARFWNQQLQDGRPWTTAGRLIPIARRLSYAVAAGQAFFVALWLFSDPGGRIGSDWQWHASAICMLLHAWMLLKDSLEADEVAGAAAGCLALATAMLPVRQIAAANGLVLPPASLLALTSLLLAWASARRRQVRAAWVYNAYIGGLLPVAAACDLALTSWQSAGWPLRAATMLMAVSALILRWRSWRGPQSLPQTGTAH